MVTLLRGTETELQEAAARITVIMLDVDGVLTDGAVTYTSTGEEIKSFNVLDGHRIKLAQKMGLRVFIITGRTSAALEKRARELSVDGLFQGVHHKGQQFDLLLSEHHLEPHQVAYLGDDLIDIPILKKAGLAGAVANCSPDIKKYCHVLTEQCGGQGAVAEFIELVLKSKQLWPQILAYYEQD